MSEKLKRLSEVEAKLQQQQHLQEIGDVSKGIAHALRNPLHTIGLAIEQLNDDQVSEKLKSKLIARVQSKIKQLDKSIKALLLITEGNFERNQQINVQTVINDVILELRQSHHIEERKLNIQVDVVDDLLITGSENEFRTLIHTLIFNSYDACESKDEITIEIKASLENGQLVIYINDFGSGLSDSIQQGLFTPHNSSKAEGAGMGLYISKRIVELYYDGTLTIANKNPETPSEGAIATLTIPCNKGE